MVEFAVQTQEACMPTFGARSLPP